MVLRTVVHAFGRLGAGAVVTLAAVAAHAAGTPPDAATEAIPDTIGQRMQPCMACHGAEGRATTQGFFPRIAGKPAGYLFNQLVAFRDGRRRNPTMAYFVDLMSDDYLREIARYFASLQLPYAPPPRSSATVAQLARGEALAR